MKGIPPGMQLVGKKIAIYSSKRRKKPIEGKNLHNYSKNTNFKEKIFLFETINDLVELNCVSQTFLFSINGFKDFKSRSGFLFANIKKRLFSPTLFPLPVTPLERWVHLLIVLKSTQILCVWMSWKMNTMCVTLVSVAFSRLCQLLLHSGTWE